MPSSIKGPRERTNTDVTALARERKGMMLNCDRAIPRMGSRREEELGGGADEMQCARRR